MKQRSSAFSFSAALTVVACLASTAITQDIPVQRNPIVTYAQPVTTTQAFRDMEPVPWPNGSKVMLEHRRYGSKHITNLPDTVAQTEVLPLVGTTNLLSFDGITDTQGGGYVPPDTNAAVGATQVVETVNIAYAVYDKTTGSQIMAPKNIQTLYTPLGGECATGQLSDPVATYDKAAGVWVITMIAYNPVNFSQNNACVAVSTSSDATGTYHLYSFNYKNVLPDYPKLGVWPDAYYLTTDSFPNGGNFTGAETCALDRTNMLLGNTAKSVCFQRPATDYAMLPADLDGSTPPPTGAPNYEMDLNTSTTLNLYQFHVDFVGSGSTFTGPTHLTVPAYTDACAATGVCIVQPSPGEVLDALGDRLMYRLAYRNFGTHESLVASHSIKASGTGKAASAVRWYEVRSPGSSPVVYQKGTFGGGTSSTAFWMGSIAMDKVGDIALGYSESSKTLKPSIAYTGRVPTDALGKMEAAHTVLTGTGVQENSFNRWGDYSSMQIDPVDDCTFWYTQEYYKASGSFNWNTHMNSFKFTACH